MLRFPYILPPHDYLHWNIYNCCTAYPLLCSICCWLFVGLRSVPTIRVGFPTFNPIPDCRFPPPPRPADYDMTRLRWMTTPTDTAFTLHVRVPRYPRTAAEPPPISALLDVTRYLTTFPHPPPLPYGLQPHLYQPDVTLLPLDVDAHDYRLRGFGSVVRS